MSSDHSHKHKQSHKISIYSEKRTEYSSISNLMIQKNNSIKIATTFSTIFLILSIVLSIVLSFIFNDKRILTFHYAALDQNKIPDAFHPNIYLLYAFLIFLISINSFSVYSIYKELDSNLIKLIYSDLKWYFVLTQFILGFQFIIGIIFDKNSYSIIFSFSLNLLYIILILVYYRAIKSKQNLAYSSFICCNLYNSVIFSFSTFLSLYNFSELLIYFLDLKDISQAGENDWTLQIFAIASFSVCCFVGIVLLAYYKDIIYCLVTIYFGLGFLCDKDYNLHRADAITVSVLSAFSFIACIMTLIKYGKFTFGYESDEAVNEVLIDRENHKKSSWFYAGQN